jgi:hypothetical protein
MLFGIVYIVLYLQSVCSLRIAKSVKMRLTSLAVSVLPNFRRLHTFQWSGGSLRRLVGTWSPLGAAFNARKADQLSQPRNLKSDSVGLFQIPELHDHSGFSVLLVLMIDVSLVLTKMIVFSVVFS